MLSLFKLHIVYHKMHILFNNLLVDFNSAGVRNVEYWLVYFKLW
jgi:hypothetical protein